MLIKNEDYARKGKLRERRGNETERRRRKKGSKGARKGRKKGKVEGTRIPLPGEDQANWTIYSRQVLSPAYGTL